MDKVKFDPKVSSFFSNYLIGRKIQYLWNSFTSPFFYIDVGAGQGSALLPILSTLYLSPVFHIFKKRTKNLEIPVLFLSFVDNGLFISWEKSFKKTNSHLFYSYNIISSLLEQFGLVIEYRKSEIFHFSKLHGLFNPPPLDLSHFRGSILKPKDTWKYLGFIFNRKSFFWQHVKFYSNKALLTVKRIKIIGNSTWSLLSHQKHLLYRTCVLSITLYSFSL